MEKQEIFDLVLKHPNAQDLYNAIHSLAWKWYEKGEVKKTTKGKKK